MNDNNFENPSLVPETKRTNHVPEALDEEAKKAQKETLRLRTHLSEVTPGPEDGWHDFTTTEKYNHPGGPMQGDIKAVGDDPNKE